MNSLLKIRFHLSKKFLNRTVVYIWVNFDVDSLFTTIIHEETITTCTTSIYNQK